MSYGDILTDTEKQYTKDMYHPLQLYENLETVRDKTHVYSIH